MHDIVDLLLFCARIVLKFQRRIVRRQHRQHHGRQQRNRRLRHAEVQPQHIDHPAVRWDPVPGLWRHSRCRHHRRPHPVRGNHHGLHQPRQHDDRPAWDRVAQHDGRCLLLLGRRKNKERDTVCARVPGHERSCQCRFDIGMDSR